jgi:hypothetical protein
MLAPRLRSALIGLVLLPVATLALSAQQGNTVQITLHVSDAKGAPVADARVSVLPPPDTTPAAAATSQDGTQSVSLVPGNYHVDISKAGFNTLAEDFKVDEAASHDLKFTLVRLGEECAEGCPQKPAAAQENAPPASAPANISAAVPPHSLAAALQPYATCQFNDDLVLAKIDALSGATTRDVETEYGHRKIDIDAGMQLEFDYPSAGPYAEAKVEQLPASKYPEEKQWLIDNFRFLYNASANTVVNRKDLGPINGYEVRGYDRVKLDDPNLGFYVMFDDANRVVTTFTLMNQENAARRFKTPKEYQQLRDQFLTSYTFCVRANQQH